MLPIEPCKVLHYVTAEGVSPFKKWLDALEKHAIIRIDRAVRRMGTGNFGDHKGVGDGVLETRINTGPGFRIYYARDGMSIVLLLAGGTKKSQKQDIANAKQRWHDYKNRKEVDAYAADSRFS